MELSSILGAACLAALWSAALLVAAAALQDARWLSALARKLRVTAGPLQDGFASVSARVEAGAGPNGQLASLQHEERGRAVDERTGVVRQLSAISRLAGGALRTGSGERIELEAGARVAVWLDEDDLPSPLERQAAAGARGAMRSDSRALRQGDEIFASGELGAVVGGWRLRAGGREPVILSSFDPSRWARARAKGCIGFAIAELLVCLACSALALSRPRFGPLSAAGALLSLGFFLGVTPLGVRLHQACAPPHRRLRVRRAPLTPAAPGEERPQPRSSASNAA